MREWTPAEESLLGTAPDGTVAKMLGCTRHSVSHRRRKLGIPAFQPPWAAWQDKLLGKFQDHVVAARTGKSIDMVLKRRKELSIGSWKGNQ